MKRFHVKVRLFAAGLSALAGYVDALGFMALGGFFVSFMSGNSTRLAVGLAQRAPSAALAGALICSFLVGVIVGSIAGRVAGRWRRPAVVGLVSLLLASAALLHLAQARTVPFIMAAAMGAENAVFENDGEVRIGLTYMTGALVKLGQGLAAMPFGGDPWGWTPYLLLWGGLVIGAVAGAVVYSAIGLSGLWIAVAAGAMLTAVAGRGVIRDQ